MSEAVQIFDPLVVASNLAFERGLALRVCRRSASAIIQLSLLCTITVDVHVGKITTSALDIDHIVVFEMVAAVAEGYTD